jgi:hypothetical protein
MVKSQPFVVPANSLVELAPEDVALHGSRVVEVETGYLTVAPLFLKPGKVFGMEGELPRAITDMLAALDAPAVAEDSEETAIRPKARRR